MEIQLKNGNRYVAEIQADKNSNEVLLHYFVDEKNAVVDGTVTCTCTCGSGSNQTSDSKTCSKEASKNAVCDCTGASASISC